MVRRRGSRSYCRTYTSNGLPIVVQIAVSYWHSLLLSSMAGSYLPTKQIVELDNTDITNC